MLRRVSDQPGWYIHQPDGYLDTRQVLEYSSSVEIFFCGGFGNPVVSWQAGSNRRSATTLSPPGLSLPSSTFTTRPGTDGLETLFSAGSMNNIADRELLKYHTQSKLSTKRADRKHQAVYKDITDSHSTASLSLSFLRGYGLTQYFIVSYL